MGGSLTVSPRSRVGMPGCAIYLGDFRIYPRAVGGNKFALEFARLPCGGESGPRSAHDYHGNLRAILSCGEFQCTARMDDLIAFAETRQGDRVLRRCSGNTVERGVGWATPCAKTASSSLRARRAAQFS